MRRRRSDRLGETPFAACLVELMDRERVGIRQLARIVGHSPTQIADLRRGTEKNGQPISPRPETIRRLARALATDWVKFQYDEQVIVDFVKKREYYRVLMRAAGYQDDVTVFSSKLPPEVEDFLNRHPEVQRVAYEAGEVGDRSPLPHLRALKFAIEEYERSQVDRERPRSWATG